MFTLFIELSSPTASAELRGVREELAKRPDVQRLELLANLEQPSLYLLLCETRTLPEFEPPEGARVWSFQRAEG